MKRLFVSGVWSVIEQASSPVVQLVLTPFIVSKIGVENYGSWTLLLSFVALGQLTSFGAGVATLKLVSSELAGGEARDASDVVRAAITVVLAGGLLVFVTVWVCGPFFGFFGD